jgi:hypothetical protein
MREVGSLERPERRGRRLRARAREVEIGPVERLEGEKRSRALRALPEVTGKRLF